MKYSTSWHGFCHLKAADIEVYLLNHLFSLGFCNLHSQKFNAKNLGLFHTSNFGRIDRMQFKQWIMEVSHLIIHCLNCIRCDQNSTFETGLTISL